jgi:hypothetical protein
MIHHMVNLAKVASERPSLASHPAQTSLAAAREKGGKKEGVQRGVRRDTAADKASSAAPDRPVDYIDEPKAGLEISADRRQSPRIYGWSGVERPDLDLLRGSLTASNLALPLQVPLQLGVVRWSSTVFSGRCLGAQRASEWLKGAQ